MSPAGYRKEKKNQFSWANAVEAGDSIAQMYNYEKRKIRITLRNTLLGFSSNNSTFCEISGSFEFQEAPH